MSISINDYLKRISAASTKQKKKTTEDAAPKIDIEAGKAGYAQYLADVEAEKAEKKKAEESKSFWQKFVRNYNNAYNAQNTNNYSLAVDMYAQDKSYMRPSDSWTDEEKWTFGEKYAKNKDDAYAYAEGVNNAIAKAKKEKQAMSISEWSKKNLGTGLLASAGSIALNALAGGAGFIDSMAQQQARGKIVEHDFLMPHEVSNTIQSSISSKLNEYGTINDSVAIFGGKGLGDLYGLGMSIGQSAFSAATGGSVGTLAQFFGMSASQGVTDALERGATAEQALAFGTISGLAEAIPEMISVKSLVGLSSAEATESVLRAVLKQAGEEAKEELTTSVITEVADLWIMKGKSQYALTVQELIASGMSPEEAENKAFTMTLENIAFDVISGAASGGLSGAGAVGVRNVKQRYFSGEANATAKEKLTPQQDSLIAEGKKYTETAKKAAALEKKLADGKELSGYELRMLASEVANAERASNVDTVRKAIVEKMKSEGVSDAEAKRLGEIALNKALGNEVSKLQDVMLKRNAAAMKVYNQIDAENMRTGMTDSEWIENTPLQQLRNEASASNEGGEVAPIQMPQDQQTMEATKPSLQARNAQNNDKINPESLEGKFAEAEGKITYEKTSEDSKIHTEGISTSLTTEEIGDISALEKLANTLGVDIYMYESKLQKDGSRSYTDKDGNVITSSGFYDPKDKSIHIDLRAGDNGEGTMLYTASHELVHFMKDISETHFDNLEKLVTEALIQGGSSIDKLIDDQRKKALANGQNLTEAQLREEMVADACQKFLASNTAIEQIKALKSENKGFWNALKRFFSSLFNKVNKIYKTVEPDGYEGRYIANMRNSVKRIRDAFMEGVAAAGEKYSAERKALGDNANVKVNADGEFVQGTTSDNRTIMTNARTWKSGGRATLKATLESEGFSADDVNAALTIMDEHMRLVQEFGTKYTAQDIANNAVLTTDVKTGESVLSAIISNGDYPVNIDLLTICKKREAYQQVINRLCESGMINKATIDSLAIAEINKILGKYGFETACLGCYVESRRIRIQEWAETIVKEWNGIVDKLEGEGKASYLNASSDTFVADLSNEQISKLSSELEAAYERDGLKYGRATVVKKMEQLQKEVPSMRKYLTVSDLITPEGRANIKSWSEELNSLINCRYGTNTPKIIQKFNPYNSELAKYGIVPRAYKSLRDYLYAIGGARMQSFSDFIVENWFDYSQIVADLAARKLPMHTYTKEAALVKLFGMTGIKINMSLIPDVDSSLGKEYAGLTKNKNGEYELIFADKDRYKATGGKSYMQSFNFADAIALQNDPNYSANIGTIAIGISDKQIEMMLDDSRIRMVIPYHSSGMNPIFAHLVGIKNYNDYTNDQNTGVKRIVDANGKEKSVKLKKEQIASLTKDFQFNEALQRLGDARKAAEEYKDWCKDTSKHTIEIDGKTYYAELTPKFEKFSAHENYYKLLADYNPYDCITEESKPQQDVTQTYPENFADMLGEELKARDIYAKKQDAKWDDAMAEINSYLETHTRADTVAYADEHGIKISAKDRKLAKQSVRHQARSIDKYTEKEYNNFGWVRANDVLTAKENERLRSIFADAVSGQSKPPKTKLGEYMIAIGDDVDNKIAYMQGEIDNPIITRVLAIDEYDETQLDKARRNIYDFERRGVQQETKGVLRLYRKTDFGSYAAYKRNVEENERNNLQLGADRGSGSGAATKIKEVIFDENGNEVSRTIRYKARNTTPAETPYVSPTATSIVTNIPSGYKYTKKDKIQSGIIASKIAFTNAQAGIEDLAKKYGIEDMEALVQAARVATNQAEEMIGGDQYAIGSDTKDYLGEGLQKIIQPIKEMGEQMESAFYDYLFHQHNADRMSLERRSTEWLNEKKEDLKERTKKFSDLQKEQTSLIGEKEKLSRKKSDSARRSEINLRLTEIKKELAALGKSMRKLGKEIDEFTILPNKPVIGLNRDEVEAQKDELTNQISELREKKKALGMKKENASQVAEIKDQIAMLTKQRSELSAEVSEEQSREIISQYEKNYDFFPDVAEKIWKYSENLNKYRVDTGLIDQSHFDYLKKLYPHYVPTYRADVKTGIAAVKGKNNLAISQTIRTATGSTKDLLNPIVIMARQTMETVRAGRINMIASRLYDGATAANDKTYLSEISRKKVAKSELVDLDPTELRPKGNQVTFFKNGEKITLQVSAEIFAGFDAFTPQFSIKNPLVKVVTAVNNGFKKLVTSMNPGFLIRNSMRDIQDAGINSKYIKTFMKNYGRAASEIVKGGSYWKLYRAMGGSNVNYFDFDKGFKAVQSKMGFQEGWRYKIENANAFVECLPRLAEFISSLEAGNSAEQAMLDAADVTTNFARTGKITKVLNSTVIPFFNPAIQGASKAVRNVMAVRSVKDFAVLAAKAVLVGIVPFALNSLLYSDDEDYEDLRETDKENNYLFKIGDTFIKLPRGRMASVLAGAYNRTVKSLFGEDADWAGYLKNASTQMNPVENMARNIFSPFLDVINNVSWYGSAIEGREFEKKSPAQRYDESTSSIAIAIGKLINYSPKKIHYILDQYSGVIGDFVLPATTKKAEKDFISGNFTIDPVTSNKLSDSFYDMYYEAQYAKSDNPNNKVAEYQVKHLNRVKKAISELYDKKSEIQNSNLSDDEKLAESRAVQVLINEIYKTALNDYDLITNAIIATEGVKDEYRYAEIQRLVYGAEAALKTYDDTVYSNSQILDKTGISYDNFYKYYFGIKDIESDKDKNGNTISGSKKKKVVKKINSLNISTEKKLLLQAYSGYKIDNESDKKKLINYLNKQSLTVDEKKALAKKLSLTYKNGKFS